MNISSTNNSPVEAYSYVSAQFTNPLNNRVITLSQMVSEAEDGTTPPYQALEDSLFQYASKFGLTPLTVNQQVSVGASPSNVVPANGETKKLDIGCIVKTYHENEDGTIIPKLLLYPSWNAAKSFGEYPVCTVYFNAHDAEAKIEKFNQWLSQLNGCELTFDTMPALGTPEVAANPNPRKADVERPYEVYFYKWNVVVPKYQATLPITAKVIKKINTKEGSKNFGNEVTTYSFIDFMQLF